jgi:hypothetical protein
MRAVLIGLRSLAFAGPSQIFAALKRSTGVNPPNFVGRRSTVKILLHLSYLIGGTDDTHGHLLSANPSYGMFSASWPFLRRLGGGRCPGIWRRPSKLFAGHCRLRGCAGYRKSVMPNRNPPLSEIKTTKQGSWRKPRKGEIARRVELYNSAYKLAWEQIPPDQKRARPDITLRIHASIRRELKEGARDPNGIALAALKDALLPDTH